MYFFLWHIRKDVSPIVRFIPDWVHYNLHTFPMYVESNVIAEEGGISFISSLRKTLLVSIEFFLKSLELYGFFTEILLLSFHLNMLKILLQTLKHNNNAATNGEALNSQIWSREPKTGGNGVF